MSMLVYGEDGKLHLRGESPEMIEPQPESNDRDGLSILEYVEKRVREVVDSIGKQNNYHDLIG